MIRVLYFGIDISKQWFDVCALTPHQHQPQRFAQSKTGLAQFQTWIQGFEFGKAHFCLEHTGGYEQKLAQWLQSQGYRVSVVDAQRVMYYRQSLGTKLKTDRVDARLLARYAQERKPETWVPRNEIYAEMTQLVRHRENLVEAKTLWNNRWKAPGTQGFVRHQLQATNQYFELMIEQVEKQIRQHVQDHPSLEEAITLLETIPGIAWTTAVKVLAEAGPISGYSSPEALALAAGVAPIACTSGKTLPKGRMPRYGNARLRQAIHMSATNAKRFNPAIRTFCERLTQKGKCPLHATKAAKRKLLHIIWGVLTSNTPFDLQKAMPVHNRT